MFRIEVEEEASEGSFFRDWYLSDKGNINVYG